MFDFQKLFSDFSQQLISEIQKFFSHFFTSLSHPFPQPPNFWNFDEYDFILFFLSFFSIFSVWIAASIFTENTIYSVPCYWDGPNYIYAAITLYNIPDDYPWARFFKYSPSYFACHLPGFPLLIKICSLIFFGNVILGNYLAILVSCFLFVYSFRRFLISFDCVKNPFFTTAIAIFFPPRFYLYHCVGASEPLFIAAVCFSFIFFKMKKPFFSLLFIWLACITRIEGLALGATLGFCFFISSQFLNAFFMFGTFLSTGFLLALHKLMFNDTLAYIHFNKNQAGIIQTLPFHELIYGSESSDVFSLLSFAYLILILFLGSVVSLEKSGISGIFGLVWAGYASLLHHMDVFRYALPGFVFAFHIGFSSFFESPKGRSTVKILAPIYFALMLLYSRGQIQSNSSGKFFLDRVLESGKDKFHR